jgi:hypothetical protein
MNVELGGGDLATVTQTDGTMSTLTAGQGLTLKAGFIYEPVELISLEATLGFKFAEMSYSNGSVQFTRIPLDVIGSVGGGGFRVGIGGTVHFQPNFKCGLSDICNGEVSLDTAFGVILQAAYRFPYKVVGATEVGLRFTHIEYSRNGSASLDGSSVGLVLGIRL